MVNDKNTTSSQIFPFILHVLIHTTLLSCTKQVVSDVILVQGIVHGLLISTTEIKSNKSQLYTLLKGYSCLCTCTEFICVNYTKLFAYKRRTFNAIFAHSEFGDKTMIVIHKGQLQRFTKSLTLSAYT